MYKGNIFLTTDNNRAVAGSMELRIYGITEFAYRLRVRQRQLVAHCSKPFYTLLYPSIPFYGQQTTVGAVAGITESRIYGITEASLCYARQQDFGFAGQQTTDNGRGGSRNYGITELWIERSRLKAHGS